MGKNLRERITRTAIRAWLPVIGLGGAGLLPCPDCGAPMMIHFWPIALVLALRNLRQARAARNHAPPNAAQSEVHSVCVVGPAPEAAKDQTKEETG